jgi:hypothetical protein
MRAETLILAATYWASTHRGIPPVERIEKSGSLPVYWGIAPRGSATSSAAWLIYKFTNDSDGDFNYSQCSMDNVKWDDRASLTYS